MKLNIEIVGKFYDNHSLAIVNRNLALGLANKEDTQVSITSLDKFNPRNKVNKEEVKELRKLEQKVDFVPDIQIRSTYPPIWKWPLYEHTKIVYIQPWEYFKAPFEWQYKFETFADALIVPSQWIKEVFALGGLRDDHCFVVPNGYNPNIFNRDKTNVENKYNIDPNKMNFVYVGNGQYRKGLDILLKAWSSVFKQADNVRLFIKDSPNIYGENNILGEILKLQYKSNTGKITYIDDNLSDKEMADIYKLCNIVVHPFRGEGFGMHIQEAVACGCFPIVSNAGPVKEFLPEEFDQKQVIKRINCNRTIINLTDSKVFATKPGDSLTLMGAHGMIDEPVVEHLMQIFHDLYFTRAHNEFNKNTDIKLTNTWENIINTYYNTLVKIHNFETTVRK